MNQSRGDHYDRSYQKYGTLASSQKPYQSSTLGKNAYYENRSPSPKYQRDLNSIKENGLSLYNGHLGKASPFENGIQEPNSGIQNVLNDPNDDFKLTMHKMSANEQAASRANLSYPQSNYTTPDAYRMMGRGTVNTNYASQAINRAMGP